MRDANTSHFAVVIWMCCHLIGLPFVSGAKPTMADEPLALSESPVLPPVAQQTATSTVRRSQAIDVLLTERNMLRGRVVNADGRGLSGIPVTLISAGLQPTSVKTDEHGSFAFRPVKGGAYVLATNRTVQTCRVWLADTAPPAAVSEVVVIDDPKIVRGQQPIENLLVGHPLLLGAVIAAAIAIPIAVHNSGSDQPAGS